MRRAPLLPKNLTRFNYWDYARVKPTPPEEIVFDSSVGPSTHERFSKEFANHLRHGPCRRPWCLWDVKLMDTPQTEWLLCLLECYVRIDREWRTDKLAWRIFRALPADAQARLRKRDQTQGKQSHRSWERILEIIARDQKVFRYIIEQKLSGRLDKVGEHFCLSEGAMRKIYVAYHRQATRLLGRESPLDQLAKKRALREVVARLTRRDAVRARRIPPVPAVCQTWAEVFAWFALALRNLKRYRNGHSPLPWVPPR